MTDPDDEAWRAIVENYGERPALDDASEDTAGGAAAAGPRADDPEEPAGASPDDRSGGPTDAPPDPPRDPPSDEQQDHAEGPPPEEPDATIARALSGGAAAEDRFVPPPAPPLPYVAPPRLAAGLGVFGAPLVLLVAVVFGISLPSWLGYLLVAAFVGGFAYLVVHMKKRPDDPWDDGARV